MIRRRSRPLPRGILASAVLSVGVGTALIVGGVLLARPATRTATLQTLVASADLEGCVEAPADWGRGNQGFFVFAYDTSGRSANPAAPPMEPDLLERVLRSGAPVRDTTKNPYAIAVVQTASEGPCAVVRVTAGRVDRVILGRFLAVLVVSTLVSMVVAGTGTYVLVMRPLERRVEALSEAADGVGREGFVAPTASQDALGHIAEVLGQSHDRIVHTRQALVLRNQALEDHLAKVAHDLRTPLASMQLALEALAAESDVALQGESRGAIADVVYLTSLVENLHQAARLRHDAPVGDGRVDLTELVARLERRFSIVGRHAGIEVAASVPDAEVWVASAPALVERAVANLLQNAVEHNRAGGHVAVTLTVADDRFELVIADDGPGLPDELTEALATGSFLDDEVRTRGPGLGMRISAEVARRAGWTLRYAPMEPRGLTATLTGPTTGV